MRFLAVELGDGNDCESVNMTLISSCGLRDCAALLNRRVTDYAG